MTRTLAGSNLEIIGNLIILHYTASKNKKVRRDVRTFLLEDLPLIANYILHTNWRLSLSIVAFATVVLRDTSLLQYPRG